MVVPKRVPGIVIDGVLPVTSKAAEAIVSKYRHFSRSPKKNSLPEPDQNDRTPLCP